MANVKRLTDKLNTLIERQGELSPDVDGEYIRLLSYYADAPRVLRADVYDVDAPADASPIWTFTMPAKVFSTGKVGYHANEKAGLARDPSVKFQVNFMLIGIKSESVAMSEADAAAVIAQLNANAGVQPAPEPEREDVSIGAALLTALATMPDD